jgi:hypothetical protein
MFQGSVFPESFFAAGIMRSHFIRYEDKVKS